MLTNIDNFFKLQNEQFLVPNLEQNMHWQQFQQKIVAKKMLQKKIKITVFAIGIVGFITTMFLIIGNTTNKNINEQIAVTSNPINNKNNNTIIETPNQKQLQSEVTKPIIAKTILPKEIKPITENHITPLATNFYIDLSKAPEIFTIDPNNSNEIICKAGTKITIPAHTVIGNTSNTVTVVVQEYYQYEKTKATSAMLKYSFYEDDKLLGSNEQNEVSINLLTDIVNGKALKLLHNSDIMPEATLKKMQWVTNEKFTVINSLKTDFKINLPAAYNAKTFMSQLSFVNHNAIIAGDIINNSIVFRKVPVGEIVYFTSLGNVNDKYFSCSKKLITGNSTTTELDFIEISKELYNKQIDELGQLGL